MSLFILIPKAGGFTGALRGFRGTREEAERYFFSPVRYPEAVNFIPARYRRDEWEVVQFADGCILKPGFDDQR